jgi:two-component system, NarL family, sensor kinase
VETVAADDPSRRELTEQILGAEQDERRRIALFLHDGPVQSLSGVALMLDAALDLIERGSSNQAIEVLEKALARTRTTVGELRDLSFSVEPVVLRDQGLAMAVNALAQDRGIEHGVRVEIDVAAAEVLGERSQAALYEIVREAFEGSIRRGPPTLFEIRAERVAPDSVEVTIHDDAPSERRRRSIEVLEERARTLGAALSVDQGDDGTTMQLRLPTYAASD